MAAKKRVSNGSLKAGPSRQSGKRSGPKILSLGKVGKIKLADIRKAVLEVRKRRVAAGI